MTCTVFLALITLGSCNGLAGDDEMDRYFQRSDTITLSAGDAKQANAVTHTINPWPPGVGDRRIITDARRASVAIRRSPTYFGQGWIVWVTALVCLASPALSVMVSERWK